MLWSRNIESALVSRAVFESGANFVFERIRTHESLIIILPCGPSSATRLLLSDAFPAQGGRVFDRPSETLFFSRACVSVSLRILAPETHKYTLPQVDCINTRQISLWTHRFACSPRLLLSRMDLDPGDQRFVNPESFLVLHFHLYIRPAFSFSKKKNGRGNDL